MENGIKNIKNCFESKPQTNIIHSTRIKNKNNYRLENYMLGNENDSR